MIDTELSNSDALGCKVQLAETIVPIILLSSNEAQVEENLQQQIIGLLKFGNSLVMQRIMEGLV